VKGKAVCIGIVQCCRRGAVAVEVQGRRLGGKGTVAVACHPTQPRKDRCRRAVIALLVCAGYEGVTGRKGEYAGVQYGRGRLLEEGARCGAVDRGVVVWHGRVYMKGGRKR